MVTLERLPDLASSIACEDVSLFTAWEFRNGRRARQFREWFDQIGPASPTELEQEYVKTLKEGGIWSSRPAKLIRFLVVQTLSAASAPVIGPASVLASMGLSAADSFLLDKIKLGFKPRYFIDDLRHKFFPNQ